MGNGKHLNRILFCARIFAVLAAFLLTPSARAQSGNHPLENRFLLVFDTSADMKKRAPMVQKTLENLFVTGFGGQLQDGDSIGVWTFDEELRTGLFPLQTWMPDEAALIANDIDSFIGKQRYSKNTRFDSLQPLLNGLVQDSERLTVLIFCDGQTAFNGTPYDAGINRIFQERQDAQKSAKQPFIIILRAQLGQYVGCTVDFPPTPVNFPAFPPLPAPPAPPVPTNEPAPPKRAVMQSIIMIGTNTETKPAPKPLLTNSEPTNMVAQQNPAAEKISTEQTNAAALSAENPRPVGGALAAGGILLTAAGGLAFFLMRRARKNNPSSLITRSMKKN